LKILDDEELASVLLHEKAHIFQKDNFSQFFIKIIKDSLPQIGFLKNSFEKINSLTELACDDYVYKVMKKKRPIISSLFKLGTVEKNSLAVNFSDSSQRIIYLTKSKSINIIKDFFSNLFLIGVAIFFSLILFLQSPANACQDSSCFKKDSDEVEFKQCLVDNIRKDFRSTVMLTE
jgi:beta-lactamase regulating signal transducer with metallopeptidase domain